MIIVEHLIKCANNNRMLKSMQVNKLSIQRCYNQHTTNTEIDRSENDYEPIYFIEHSELMKHLEISHIHESKNQQ